MVVAVVGAAVVVVAQHFLVRGEGGSVEVQVEAALCGLDRVNKSDADPVTAHVDSRASDCVYAQVRHGKFGGEVLVVVGRHHHRSVSLIEDR